MNIATITVAHDHLPVVRDTIDSIQTWMTKKNLIVVDAAGWDKFEGQDVSGAEIACGYWHAARQSPYRNSVYGVKLARDRWPKADWYLYFEYDGLVANDGFI